MHTHNTAQQRSAWPWLLEEIRPKGNLRLLRTIMANMPSVACGALQLKENTHNNESSARFCFPPAHSFIQSEPQTSTGYRMGTTILCWVQPSRAWLPRLCVLAAMLCYRNYLLTECHKSKQLAHKQAYLL